MKNVVLRQMTEEEYRNWRAWSVKNYINEMVKTRNLNRTDSNVHDEKFF